MNVDTDGNRMVWDETLRQWVPVTGALSPAELADQMQPVLSSRYAPLADTTSIWLAPSDFAINAGSPSIATGLLIPSIALDPTSIEIITAGFRTPSSWVTADVTLWYYTASAVGNFVINPRIYLAANGESAAPSAEAGITSSITVAGSTAAIANTKACGTFTCRSNAVGSFWLQRDATSGSDTNAGDFSVLGVAITKAS